MTQELFRQDSYIKQCDAEVVAVNGNAVILDQTVFYPQGGGQPGDSGVMHLADGRSIEIVDTQKDRQEILH